VNGRVPVRTIDKDIEWKITRIFEVEANVVQIDEMNSTVPTVEECCRWCSIAIDRPDDEEGKRVAPNNILEDLRS